MKKYIYIVLALASVLCACSRDEDSLFYKSASERAQEAIENAAEVLVAPAAGWEMIYFANTESRGYNILLRFESNGRVTATAKNKVTTNDKMLTDSLSTWVVKLDYGPILSFDTYNDVFHAWSDPQDDGDGLLGDYEFLILSATPERVLLKGKKHSGYSVLRPMPIGMTDEQYFAGVATTLSKCFSNDNILTLHQGGKKFYLHNGATGIFSLSAYGEKPSTVDPETYPICATLDGFMACYGFNGNKDERFFSMEENRFVGESGSIIDPDDLNTLYLTYIDVNKGWTADLKNSTGAFADVVAAFQTQLQTLTGDSKAKLNSVAVTYSDTAFRYEGSYVLRIKYEYKKSGSKQSLVADFAINVSNTKKAGLIVLDYLEPINGTARTWYRQASEMPNLVAAATGEYMLSTGSDPLNPAKSLRMEKEGSMILCSGASNLK